MASRRGHRIAAGVLRCRPWTTMGTSSPHPSPLVAPSAAAINTRTSLQQSVMTCGLRYGGFFSLIRSSSTKSAKVDHTFHERLWLGMDSTRPIKNQEIRAYLARKEERECRQLLLNEKRLHCSDYLSSIQSDILAELKSVKKSKLPPEGPWRVLALMCLAVSVGVAYAVAMSTLTQPRR